MNMFRRITVVVLSSLLAALPAMPQPQTNNQPAGEINALIPAATRNSQPAKVKEDLNWNDLLQTQHSGRVRAGLKDGSILSLGSDSELRIVQHDSASQQTSLEMDFGKIRSQVVKISKPGGKFEMKTPNAVIGVIGTDFYVGFESNTTTVICYKGKVSVTPTNGAHTGNNSGQSNTASNSVTVTVSAGQMVQITSEIPPSGFQATDTPPAALQASLTDTDIPTNAGIPHQGHTLRWIFIGTAVAVGLGVGLGVGLTRGGGTTPPPTDRNPNPAP
jgi:ferric-dicitrate binding protein FerR (iron transport regulator)